MLLQTPTIKPTPVHSRLPMPTQSTHLPDLLSHLHSNWIIVFPIMEKYMTRIEFPPDDSITFNSLLVPAYLPCCASCCYGRTTCAPR